MRIMRANPSLSLFSRSYLEKRLQSHQWYCQYAKAECHRQAAEKMMNDMDANRWHTEPGECQKRQRLLLRIWPCCRSVAVVWTFIAATDVDTQANTYQTLICAFTVKRGATAAPTRHRGICHFCHLRFAVCHIQNVAFEVINHKIAAGYLIIITWKNKRRSKQIKLQFIKFDSIGNGQARGSASLRPCTAAIDFAPLGVYDFRLLCGSR